MNEILKFDNRINNKNERRIYSSKNSTLILIFIWSAL